jgi:predicted DNA-binding ribbon-helix-helix protein
MLKKRSVTIAGHRTSISLEDEFWAELVRIAGERGESLNMLVAKIDDSRETNLSSAIRLFVLAHLKRSKIPG